MKKLKNLLSLGILWATLTAVPLDSYAYVATTVDVVYDTASGIENTDYIATLNDGTVLGFRSRYGGYQFTGAISQEGEISVPDSIRIPGNHKASAVICIDNYCDFMSAQSVISLKLPKTIDYLYGMPSSVKVLHMNNYVSNIYSSTLTNLDKVLVPEESLTDFLNNDTWRCGVLINAEGTEPLKITINMTKAGEFAQMLLQLTDNWYKVNEVTVVGDLNENDLNVFYRMEQLTDLDLAKANIESVPDNFSGISNYGYGLGILRKVALPEIESIGIRAFYNCRKLKDITIPKVREIKNYAFRYCGMSQISLPEGLESIGQYAFYESQLESIAIPSSVTSIKYGCFQNTPLESVSIPPSITTIDDYAFESTNLKSVTLPKVEKIGSYAFSKCSQLSEVNFAEGLYEIGSSAFSNCKALTKIDLPSSMLNVNGKAFGYCTNLKSVTSCAVVPPTHNGSNSILYGCDKTDVTLYVPAMSIDTYRAEPGWDSFYTILPMSEKISNAYIYDEVIVENPSVFTNDCKLTLGWQYQYHKGTNGYWCGALDYNGSSTFSVKDFKQYHELGNSSSGNQYYNNARLTSLIPNGPMRADNVHTAIRFNSQSVWYFISLPYDVKVSEIIYPDENQFVIRRYSGCNRAQQSGDTWLNLTTDSIMHAYEGYIFRCNKNDAEFTFPAINNANKNKIFEKESVVMPLGEYLSEFEHNRSWNLVGNPYPCYYDTRYMDFTSPITVWNRYNKRYDAYSPIDDSFILRPTQAFFVQRPVNQSSITFNKEGRQNNNSVREMSASSIRHKTPCLDSRKIFNLILSGDTMEDRTRIVINSEATCSYELDKDASKFFTDDNTSVLVYTLHNGVKYAINERPLSDGLVNLGFYAPSAGEYTLSLDMLESEDVILIDNVEKKETPLSGEYHFSAAAGFNDSRFTICFGPTTGIDSIIADSGMTDSNVLKAVYTTDGRFVGNYSDEEISALPKGIYIVSSKDANRKIVVK